MRLTRFVHAIRTSLWLVPLLCVLAGVLIALGTICSTAGRATPWSRRA